MSELVDAAVNPALAQKLANEAMKETKQVTVGVPEEVKPAPLPPDTSVELIAGYMDPVSGEVELQAEVRELNGVDEEALSRITDMGKVLLTTLERGTAKIGNERASKEKLDALLAGDRELLLVAIRKVTFGPEVKLEGACPLCGAENQTFDVDLDKDVKVRRLDDPTDRSFTVSCKVGEVDVQLPNGKTQAKLVSASDKTQAELDTILLKDCIGAINGMPVWDIKQIQSLGIKDRREIIKQLSERNPGPLLSEITKSCGSCGQEVPLPLTLADLFRL